MGPKVSIILPVYNNQETVRVAIVSILTQTFTDFELIVTNDGSKDQTDALLQSISDPRLKILKSSDNMGLPRRLNEAINEAKGEYIARMDADDIAFPDRIAKQVAFLDTHTNVDLLATRALVFDSDGNILGLLPFAQHHREIIKNPWHAFPMPHPTWMARRAWMVKHPYALPEVWRAEDQDLLLRSHKESTYACLPDILLCYRQGIFNYHKVSLARRNLLRAQLDYFKKHKEWGHAGLAIAAFLIKSAADLLYKWRGISKPVVKSNFTDAIPDETRMAAQNLIRMK